MFKGAFSVNHNFDKPLGEIPALDTSHAPQGGTCSLLVELIIPTF